MKNLIPLSLVFMVLISGCSGSTNPSTSASTLIELTSTTPAEPGEDTADKLKDGSLYSRMGGIKNIRIFVDRLSENISSDTVINHFFISLSGGRLINLKQRIIEQVCMITGGPCTYTGRAMPDVHKALNITDADFTAFINDAGRALDSATVQATEKGEITNVLTGLKDMIVSSTPTPSPSPSPTASSSADPVVTSPTPTPSPVPSP